MIKSQLQLDVNQEANASCLRAARTSLILASGHAPRAAQGERRSDLPFGVSLVVFCCFQLQELVSFLSSSSETLLVSV